MQIAKMFASLGFQVDSAGLDTFKSGLKQAKDSLNGLTSEVKAAKKPLEELKRKLTEVGKVKLSFGSASNSANLKSSIKGVNDQLDKVITRRAGVTDALGKINAALIVGAGYWDRYRESVVKARTSLHNINSELRNLRANSNITVRVNRQDGGGGLGGGGGGGPSLTDGLLGLGAAKHFFGNFLPAAALATIAGSSGFIAKGAINQGREQTKMETMLMMTAKSTDHFRDSLKYVRSEALRLGLSSVELGKSFAQISMSAKALNQEQKKEMFTGFSEFMLAMGTNKDDQKGVFRAFNQMFGAGRILQEEINQLTERGIPATLVMDAAKQAYNTDDTQFIKKLQKDGKLDPNKVLPIMAKMVQQLAHDTGALDKMQRSSLYKQQVFMESLSQFSQRLMDSGLDEWLGSMFGKLTELVDVLEEVINGVRGTIELFKAFKQVTEDMTGGHSWLIAVLGLLLFRFKHIIRVAKILTTQIRAGSTASRLFSTLLTGTFGRALGATVGGIAKVIGKFFLWFTVISLVVKGLRWVHRELKRRDEGQLTVFDKMIWKMEEISAWFRMLGAQADWFFGNLKYAAIDMARIGPVDLLGTNLELNNMYETPPPRTSNMNGAGGSWGDDTPTKKPEQQKSLVDKLFDKLKSESTRPVENNIYIANGMTAEIRQLSG
ncbi:tape measure protein [Edwardsiella phage vB_EtaM_ET-ABTNL-9]|nr:tape measure protein [Edwardsiella phage vB_EtaM_ET-ABTNL-9]